MLCKITICRVERLLLIPFAALVTWIIRKAVKVRQDAQTSPKYLMPWYGTITDEFNGAIPGE
jgi:hypothetical protein